MEKEQVKSILRQDSCRINNDLKYNLEQYLPQLDNVAKNEILTQCAMLATKHGILSNVKTLVEENPDILKQQQCGIFRICAEIEQLQDFKNIMDFILDTSKKAVIDVNALEVGFLRECIKRNKLEYIHYVVEYKKLNFDFQNNTLIKTLLRYENADILHYFVVDLKVMIDNDEIKNYMLENHHKEAFDKINKCNMFIKLGKKLYNKNMTIKVNKI